MAQECTVCGHEVGDQAQICPPCTGGLSRNLRDMPEITEDLLTTMSRQDRLAAMSDGARATESPLAWKDAAAETYREIRRGLRQWVEHYTGAAHSVTDRPVTDLARVLVNILGQIRMDDTAGEFALKTRSAVAKARRVVDKPPERIYLGPCGIEDGDEALCKEELFARRTDDTVTCPACGAEHSTDARRGFLIDTVEDKNVSAATVAGVLMSHMGATVTTSMIRGYEHRGRLHCKGRDRSGRKIYRVGDVMNVLAGKSEDEGFNVSA